MYLHMPKVSVVDISGFVFREPFSHCAHPAFGMGAAILYRSPLLGSADWLSDGHMIHTGPVGALA